MPLPVALELDDDDAEPVLDALASEAVARLHNRLHTGPLDRPAARATSGQALLHRGSGFTIRQTDLLDALKIVNLPGIEESVHFEVDCDHMRVSVTGKSGSFCEVIAPVLFGPPAKILAFEYPAVLFKRWLSTRQRKHQNSNALLECRLHPTRKLLKMLVRIDSEAGDIRLNHRTRGRSVSTALMPSYQLTVAVVPPLARRPWDDVSEAGTLLDNENLAALIAALSPIVPHAREDVRHAQLDVGPEGAFALRPHGRIAMRATREAFTPPRLCLHQADLRTVRHVLNRAMRGHTYLAYTLGHQIFTDGVLRCAVRDPDLSLPPISATRQVARNTVELPHRMQAPSVGRTETSARLVAGLSGGVRPPIPAAQNRQPHHTFAGVVASAAVTLLDAVDHQAKRRRATGAVDAHRLVRFDLIARGTDARLKISGSTASHTIEGEIRAIQWHADIPEASDAPGPEMEAAEDPGPRTIATIHALCSDLHTAVSLMSGETLTLGVGEGWFSLVSEGNGTRVTTWMPDAMGAARDR